MKPKRKCRVLMLLENNPYPSDQRVRREANSLVAAGFQVTVISPDRADLSRYENVDGVHVYRFPRPAAGDSFVGYLWEYGWSMFCSFWLALWVFFRRGFDVIHAHNPPDMFVLIAICYRMFGKKFVFDHHDLSPEMYNARFRGGGRKSVVRVLEFFETLSCRWAHQIIATNESYKKVEIERSRISPEKITIVRNGPDINKMKPVTPDPEIRRLASTILGFVGGMEPQDGVDYLIRSLDYLVRELGRTDVYAVIMGSGSAVPSLKKLTAELGLEAYVVFTGKVAHLELPRYLSAVDICVDSNPYDLYNDRSTMIKMMDYMAVAKPIVAFDLTEHHASAGDAALYALPNNERDFADKIAILIDSPELCQRMGDCGRQRMEEKLAWHHQEQNLLQVYAKLGYEAERKLEPIEPAIELETV